MHTSLIIATVLTGCGINAVFLELLTGNDPGSGNIVTCGQFLFIAAIGFVFTTKFGTRKRQIPLKHYMILVGLFFVANITNNYAFNFDISMPLHMIFRSGSLISSMFLGIVLLKRKYSVAKYISVFMVTVGIVMCTLASQKPQVESYPNLDASPKNNITIVIGVCILTVALLVSSGLGIYQEMLFKKYGKQTAKEALFYSHAIPLPGFLMMSKNIYEHSLLFTASEQLIIPALGLSTPKLWIFLLGNVVTQYVCISSVYSLTSECTSLTVTLVVTLRKFLSLLFSIFYFSNPFTAQHWLGTVLVFAGTLFFIDIVNMVRTSIKTADADRAPLFKKIKKH